MFHVVQVVRLIANGPGSIMKLLVTPDNADERLVAMIRELLDRMDEVRRQAAAGVLHGPPVLQRQARLQHA